MKHILITGSTDGIGKLAAIKLAKDGHVIYLHGRSQEKLDKVIAEVRQESKSEKIRGFIADFSDLEAVKAMGSQIVEEIPQLDVLINNAGVYKTSAQTNNPGIDLRMVVNFLAPMVLTKSVLPLIRESNDGRIINLSSAAQAPVSLDVLRGNRQIGAQDAYAQSKLALTMWSHHLAKEERDLTVIAVNPGSLLNTRMVKEAFGHHWSSADKGGNILYELATSSAYQGQSGKYFDNDKGDPKGRFSEAHPDAYNDSKIETLLSVAQGVIGQ